MKFISKKTFLNLMLAFATLILTLGILELSARVYKSEYTIQNFWDLHKNLLNSAYPAQFDKRLGWIPKQGLAQKNLWNTNVIILEYGIRSNGNRTDLLVKESDNLILVIGDSFTFGDQASDNETWSAYLEELTGIETLNGGVFGYGLDQTYLRMKILEKQYQPTHIILSIVPTDVFRSELSERSSTLKPYFEIIEDELILRDEHIIERPKLENRDFLRKTLGYSYLAHKLMLRTFPKYWLQGQWESIQVHSDGEAIACRLLNEIDDFLEETPTIKEFIILIQYRSEPPQSHVEMIDRVLDCADKEKIKVVNLRSVFTELKEENNKSYQQMWDGHMTAKGNEFVAQYLSEVLSK